MYPIKSLAGSAVVRTTARKSVVQQVRPKSTKTSPAAAPPPPAAAAAAPGLPLNVNGLITPPSKIDNPPPPAKPSITKTVPMKKIRAGDEAPELKVTSLGSKGGVSSIADRKGKSVAEVDKVAAGPKMRKVVKKVTRVVKKIVKRKVPKRSLLGAQADGLAEGSVLTVNPVEAVPPNSNATSAKKVDSELHASFGDDVINDRFESLSPIEDANVGTDETANPEISCPVSEGNEEALEVEKEKLEDVQVCTEEVAKVDPSAGRVLEGETVEEMRGDRFESLSPVEAACVETDDIEDLEITSSESIKNEEAMEDVQEEEIAKIDPSAERVVEGETVEEMGGTSCGSSSQGFAAEENDGNERMMVEDQSRNENLELVEMKIGDNSEGLSESSVLEGKRDARFNGAQTLGGEMEALERRKRRKTEIFVGGLDKTTKQEDIRKLFEQVGEIKQVRLVNSKNNRKNKNFAFVQYVSAEDAKKALEKFSTVEICGEQCRVNAVEGNDTLFLGNIKKSWKTKDVVQQLQAAKILNIDQVVLMANPNNPEINRGFAFVEFQTVRDAQVALSILEKDDFFVKHLKIKVNWAQPLIEPNEEDLLKVRTVYVEHIPSFWDEAKAQTFFKRFGEIESISLAKNLPSARRKDIAFVNYLKREAALACIEACAHERGDDGGSEVKVKASLAKPVNKLKETKQVVGTSRRERAIEKRRTSNIVRVHDPRKSETRISKNLEGGRVDGASSTTDELLLLLRQQAQVRQPQSELLDPTHHYDSAGSKRPYSALGNQSNHAIYPESRGFSHPHSETSHVYGSISRADIVSMQYSQGRRVAPTLELPREFEMDPHHKTRERTAYFGPSDSGTRTYRRY